MDLSVLDAIRGGIIISCQATEKDPTYGTAFMTAFALAAKQGGAVGIRCNGPQDVAAIKKATGLPVIGIWKRPCSDGLGHIITPTMEDARAVVEAGADIVAIDVTDRPRPGEVDAVTLVQRIIDELGVVVMADCYDLPQAVRAEDAGAHITATTMALWPGMGPYEPNLPLLRQMCKTVRVPVIAEGQYWEPEDVRRAFQAGVWAVVIGSAVTRPWLITRRYVEVSPRGAGK
jgi:N-acylglucosamine-6-phosphate 2-epimerase